MSDDTKPAPPADEPLRFIPSDQLIDARRFIALLRSWGDDPSNRPQISALARTLAAEWSAEYPKIAELLGDPVPLVESALRLMATMIGETCKQVAQVAELSRVTAHTRINAMTIQKLVIQCIPTVVPDDPAEPEKPKGPENPGAHLSIEKPSP